jgi:hypothetical protein
VHGVDLVERDDRPAFRRHSASTRRPALVIARRRPPSTTSTSASASRTAPVEARVERGERCRVWHPGVSTNTNCATVPLGQDADDAMAVSAACAT